MMESLYIPYDHEPAIFGEHWTNPPRYEHGKDILCARYKASGDGHPVEVYCDAMPARFYTIKVLPGPNSVNELRPGWKLATGSGTDMCRLAHEIAKAVSEGMLDMSI